MLVLVLVLVFLRVLILVFISVFVLELVVISILVLRTPAAGHRRPLVSSNCGSICKTSADICEWWPPRAIPGGAILDWRYCKNGQKLPFRIDCIAFQEMEAFRDPDGPGRRYLKTVRPVAMVPFQNEGPGAF